MASWNNSTQTAQSLSTRPSFVLGDIEELKPKGEGDFFSLAVANMSLMAVVHLDKCIDALARSLRPGGRLVFTITHPCFWPQYWNYSKEWFCYGEENVIEAPFHISLDHSDQFLTTHVHRPLNYYISTLESSGFRIVRMLEPMPSSAVEKLYPRPWEYPRFLGAMCVRQ